MQPATMKNLRGFFTRKKVNIKTDDKDISLPLVAWDSISVCDGKTCPVGAKRCPYYATIAGKIARSGKEQRCFVQARYLRLVYQNFIQVNTRKQADQMDESVMTDIGLLLLPLYGHLIKFKLIEAGLGYNDIQRADGRINPIYQQIQSTIKAIRETAKDVLPTKFVKTAAQCLDVNNVLYPQNNYHEMLERSAQKQYEQGKTYELQTK